MTSEKEIGKNPTTSSRKGINRLPMMVGPYFVTQFIALSATKVISTGKKIVRMVMGTMMRQSRRESRTSRLTRVNTMRSQSPCAVCTRLVIVVICRHSSTTCK